MSQQNTDADRVLVPVEGIPHELHYRLQGLPGTTAGPWLETETAARLQRVDQALREQGFHLLIWDAWRSKTTQQAISDRYRDELVAAGLDADQASRDVRNFIADPSGVFPHGTGGVVDLTLGRDGVDADCGTGFDEFTDRSHRDWFALNPPIDDLTHSQQRRRELLQSAMEAQGFVGLPHEWWHFEWGTRRWAAMTAPGGPSSDGAASAIVLGRRLTPPGWVDDSH